MSVEMVLPSDEAPPKATKKSSKSTEAAPATITFGSFLSSLGIDVRLRKAVARMNIVTPTEIQRQSLPLSIEGKDLLVKARTGSGKTLAYLLPVLHNILR
jgi:ATP-dependent RNA helicase DDX56/DBP9